MSRRRLDWDGARRRDRVAEYPQLLATPLAPVSPRQKRRDRGRDTRPLGKDRARRYGVCPKCRQKFRPGQYAVPFAGRTRGPQVYQHKGVCPVP